jgi:polar amino acid transport system substrate-binding protein
MMISIRRRFSNGLVLTCWLLFFVPALAAEKLVLNTGELPPYSTSDGKGFANLLVLALFREIGVDAELIVYKGAFARALINANQGVEDGVAARVAGLEIQYPNLIRLPDEMVTVEMVAFGTKHRFATPDWNALSPYVIGHINGWRNVEVPIDKLRESGPLEVTAVSDAQHLFMLLEKGRADVVIYERLHGLMKAREMGIKVQVMEPPLATTKLYLYLNKKHVELVPRLAEALVKLKKNGTYKRLYDTMLVRAD